MIELLEESIFIREKTGIEPVAFMKKSAKHIVPYIKPSDKLYIVAHGDRNGLGHGLIYDDALTPSQLAHHLNSLKLDRDFRDLRIFACDSGCNHSMHIPSVAARLKESLLSLGYKKIVVTGYMGKVILNRDYRISKDMKLDKRKRKGIIPSDDIFSANEFNEIFIASQFKVVF
ncbi:hypothetical protein DS043_17475 [Escherichia coli]|nr:hypothetical protein [Escherichia coli]EFP6925866.1 hypothetical protein [Shigella dysenteriae]EJF5753387.1 hypothetical protein [Shigella sonnei]EFO2173084.1 hypothetical protein [Escherichia coli]EFP9422953.1 hypothetical protein [Shigella dysenteriae]